MVALGGNQLPDLISPVSGRVHQDTRLPLVLESKAFAVDADDDGMVQDMVEHRRGDHAVARASVRTYREVTSRSTNVWRHGAAPLATRDCRVSGPGNRHDGFVTPPFPLSGGKRNYLVSCDKKRLANHEDQTAYA